MAALPPAPDSPEPLIVPDAALAPPNVPPLALRLHELSKRLRERADTTWRMIRNAHTTLQTGYALLAQREERHLEQTARRLEPHESH